MQLKTLAISMAAALGAFSVSAAALAQDFPTKPITIIVPSSAGGPLDLMARALAEPMSKTLGQPVVVENKAGANGVIGSEFVAKSDPDGHTILIATQSHTANMVLVKDIPYDVEKDFIPLIQVARTYGQIMMTRPDFPAKDIAEFVALAKANPGKKFTYATSGYGNGTHVSAAYFAKLAGIEMQDVQYKGSAASNLQDVMSGVVDLTFLSPTPAAPYINEKTLRAYAVASDERVPAFPDIPTFKELGYDMALPSFYGMHVPAGTPKAVVDELYDAVAKAVDDPVADKAIFGPGGFIETKLNPEEFAAFIKNDLEYQKKVMAAIGLEPQ
jgi:tripartite-type tricarboxylate transporter receptor subunit TctC